MTDTLKAGIFTAMNADSTLTALLVDRIFPDRANQTDSLPYITYNIRTELGVHHQTGVDGLALTEVQFSIWAASSESRQSVKDAVRDLFDGKIRQTFGSSFCPSVRNTSNTDTTDDPEDGSQNFAFGVFMDFEFWHQR